MSKEIEQAKKDVNNAADTIGISTGGNFFEDVANSYVNVTTRILTGGDMGYKDGKFTGTPFRALNETVGEVTGRNQARQALNEARDAAQEEKKVKLQEISNENKRKESQDIQSSQRAASIRATVAAQRNNLLGGSGARLGGTRDFLGI